MSDLELDSFENLRNLQFYKVLRDMKVSSLFYRYTNQCVVFFLTKHMYVCIYMYMYIIQLKLKLFP